MSNISQTFIIIWLYVSFHAFFLFFFFFLFICLIYIQQVCNVLNRNKYFTFLINYNFSSFLFLGRWLSFHSLQLQCDWFAFGMVFDASWSSYSLSWRSSCDKWDSLHYDIICWSINCQKIIQNICKRKLQKLVFWIWKKFAIPTLFSQFRCKSFCGMHLSDFSKFFSFDNES